MNELFYRPGGFLVHHLQPGRNDAGADDVRHRLAGLDDVVKCSEDDLGFFRFGQQLDGNFSHHAEHAFRAGNQCKQVVARRIQAFRTDLEQLAFDVDEAQFQDVVHRQAVFEAVHAAGIFRHVAADGAGDLAGRIGCVIQSVGCGRFRDSGIAHPRLHACHACNGIDVDDFLHLRHHQQQALRIRQRATG